MLPVTKARPGVMLYREWHHVQPKRVTGARSSFSSSSGAACGGHWHWHHGRKRSWTATRRPTSSGAGARGAAQLTKIAAVPLMHHVQLWVTSTHRRRGGRRQWGNNQRPSRLGVTAWAQSSWMQRRRGVGWVARLGRRLDGTGWIGTTTTNAGCGAGAWRVHACAWRACSWGRREGEATTRGWVGGKGGTIVIHKIGEERKEGSVCSRDKSGTWQATGQLGPGRITTTNHQNKQKHPKPTTTKAKNRTPNQHAHALL